MKKSLSLLLALIMIVSVFAACGEKPADTAAPEDTQSEETASEQTTAPADTQNPADTQTSSVTQTTATPDEEPHYRQFDDPYKEGN